MPTWESFIAAGNLFTVFETYHSHLPQWQTFQIHPFHYIKHVGDVLDSAGQINSKTPPNIHTRKENSAQIKFSLSSNSKIIWHIVPPSILPKVSKTVWWSFSNTISVWRRISYTPIIRDPLSNTKIIRSSLPHIKSIWSPKISQNLIQY